MLRKFFHKILPFALIVFFPIVSNGQEKVCDLKVIARMHESRELVREIKATAESVDEKKLYKSVEKDGMPYFESLPEGQYKITGVKEGYKQSVFSLFHKCDSNKDGALEQTLFLDMLKGSSKEVAAIPKTKGAFIIDPNVSQTVGLNSTNGGKGSEFTGFKDESGNLNKGIVNHGAIKLVRPEYSRAARYVRAAGAVNIQVLIDEEGNVVSAQAVSGNPLLHPASIKAALESKFKPTLLSGKPVKVNGIIVYNFVL